MTGVSCGTPTPATIRVVQIEPGPMPTLIASAPASISARVASAVATLPATTWAELESFFTRSTARATSLLWPWAVSMMTTSHSAASSASVRSKPLSPTVVAAATRRRPAASLVALGKVTAFSMSLTVIRPMQRKASSTTSSFSIRRWWSRRRASSWPTPSFTVARFSCVISSRTGWAGLSAKRTSRLVTMPTSLPPASTTGMPLIRLAAMIAWASPRVALGPIVIGLTTIPLSKRLTARTAAHCSSIVRLRWRTPIPPIWAMTIAMSASVTVSIAEETTGMLSAISRVRRVRVSAWEGTISLSAGRSRTSSKVRPRGMSMIATVRLCGTIRGGPCNQAGPLGLVPRRSCLGLNFGLWAGRGRHHTPSPRT